MGEALAITLVVTGIEFTPATISAPAGRPLAVTLDNQDDGVPHSLVLKAGAGFTVELAKSVVQVGPARLQPLLVPGLVPGPYRWVCEVHPTRRARVDGGFVRIGTQPCTFIWIWSLSMARTKRAAVGSSERRPERPRSGAARWADQPPPVTPPRPGSVIAAGSSSRSRSSAVSPRSRASSRMVRPLLSASFARAAAPS